MRRGRGSGGQIAVSSIFRKLVTPETPHIRSLDYPNTLASATFR